MEQTPPALVQPAPPAVGGPAPPLLLPPPPPPLAAALPLFQEARYDIRYGILGSVGTLTFSVAGVEAAADGSRVVQIEGAGAGAVLGLGSIERKIAAEFDPVALQSRRWTILRVRNGQHEDQGTRDTGARGDRGALLLERSRPGQPPARQTVTFAVPTSDPLGLLWRLRTAPPPPEQSEVFHLLDGLTLWRVRVTTAAGREILPEGNRTAIKLDGALDPIFFDGQSDGSRPSRRFTLWLSDGTDHLPLRMEVPVGLADVVMTLTEAHSLPKGSTTARPTAPGGPPAAGTEAPAGGRARDGDRTHRCWNPAAGLARPGPCPDQLTGPVPGARNL